MTADYNFFAKLKNQWIFAFYMKQFFYKWYKLKNPLLDKLVI